MKNQWIKFVTGYYVIEVTGIGAERFINLCLRHNIYIWHVKRHGSAAITCYISREDIDHIHPFLEGTDWTLKLIGEYGLPGLYKKMLKNSGIVVGISLFLLVITLLSNMVWGIEIRGAKPETAHLLSRQLEEMGITKGKFTFLLPSPEEIQREITERLENVTWVGVQLNGTTYHFQVVEKKIAEKQKENGPGHLVATKKAIIHNLFVEKGQPQVKINDYVKPGQILVSGIIGKDKNTEIVAAKGEIFGETWYKSNVTVPLKTELSVYTGNQYKKYSIGLFGVNIPIWGFKQPSFTHFEVNESEPSLHFLKWKLPIRLKTSTILEKENVVRAYTEQQAIKAAIKSAKDDIVQILDEDAIMKEEKILHKSVKNGKVNVILHFTVIEEISAEQSIIQGD